MKRVDPETIDQVIDRIVAELMWLREAVRTNGSETTGGSETALGGALPVDPDDQPGSRDDVHGDDGIHRVPGAGAEAQGCEADIPDGEYDAQTDCTWPVSSDDMQSVASLLIERWGQEEQSSEYVNGDLRIDLSTVEGRAHFLVFATLLAAKVREPVAVHTFQILRDEGLLSVERLSAACPYDQEQMLAILRSEYRAVVNKASKRDAIYANQHLLNREWAGDLNNLYMRHRGDDAALLAALQSFSHLKRRALWLVREMKVRGLWPDVGPGATAFYDTHVRRVLHRLHYVGDPDGDWREASLAECEEAVDVWFEGDLVPLYLHGSRLCAAEDLAVCAKLCTVKEYCLFWRRHEVDWD